MGYQIFTLCGIEDESSFHALVSCSHARNIWEHMCVIWPLPRDVLLVDSENDWLLNVLMNCTATMQEMVITLIWCIWQLQNDL